MIKQLNPDSVLANNPEFIKMIFVQQKSLAELYPLI